MVVTMTVNSQKGFTLVELMIGMTISLIIMAGAVYVFVNISQVSLFNTRAVNALVIAKDALDLMARDIRRAGYQGHMARLDDVDGENPYDYFAINSAGNCIAYSFNVDDSWDEYDSEPEEKVFDGISSEVADADEYFGFQLKSGELKTLSTSGSIPTVIDIEKICDDSEDHSEWVTWYGMTSSGALDVSEANLTFILFDDLTTYPYRVVEIELSNAKSKLVGGQSSSFTLHKKVDIPN